MIVLNGIKFAERHESPGVGSKVGLRAFFYNNGQPIDPVTVSSVSVFKYSSYANSKLFDSATNLLDAEPLMQFAPSSPWATNNPLFPTDPGSPAPADDYSAEWGGGEEFSRASGIFKLGTGDFVAPLALDTALSGVWEVDVELEASSNINQATTYIDVWTVKLLQDSKPQTFINRWDLSEDTFFSITQPLLVKTSAKLSNKHIRYGEVVDLKFPVEVTIENKDIDDSIINVLKSSLIVEPKLKIVKVNDNPTLDGPFLVLDFSDVQTINVTADGTILYSWNTNTISSSPWITGPEFGEVKGTYSVQVRYFVNSETIISPRFYVTIN